MVQLLVIIIIFLLILVGLLLIVAHIKRRSFGSLSQNHIYSDTQQMPGSILYSDNFTLKGKPDYILKRGNEYIPVEVKTGKTPNAPYKNHIMQLVAYCVLIEDNYHQRPKIGIVKYPEKEFVIEYTDELKQTLKKTIDEMMDIKSSGKELFCNHPEHNTISL